MGCPQSKTKSKDVSAGGDGNGHVGRTRNDAVRPEEQTKMRMPTKHAHEFNDDPLVRGRADPFPDIEIDNEEGEDIKPDTKDQEKKDTKDINKINSDTHSNVEGKIGVKIDRASEKIDDVKAKVNEKLPESSKVEPLNTVNAEKVTNQGKEISKVVTKEKDRIPNMKLPGVFIPDEDSDGSEVANPKFKVSDNNIIDVNDISIGQPLSEIEMANETVNINGEAAVKDQTSMRPKPDIPTAVNSNEGGVGVYSPEDNTDKTLEKRQSAKGSPSVRYQGKDKVTYGLPEGVPKPAPPKTRKAEIVKPNAFTIADRIVDETPDKGVASITKLASYLSGTAKKTDLETSEDRPETGINVPAPAPVKTKKKDLVPDVSMFKAIDENARNTPESVRMSIDKLVAHLVKVATSDLEKVRAFYFWICHNISYVFDKGDEDTDAGKLRFDAVSTLRQGKGSYVNLVAAFCKEVGIPCVTIPGCSKGLRHQPDKEFAIGERNHSWNAVYVNGEWRFLDCTWGSGFLDINGKFHHQFDEFWFLTDSEVHAYDHFPAHPAWQLLDEPIDIDEFNKKPSLTERSRELGFKLISHREPIIYVQDEVTVVFGTETYPLSNITADFRSTDGDEVNRHRCMRRIDDKTFEVRVIPPQPGQYSLLLYGKARDYRHTKYRKLMEYTLRVESVYPDQVIFPNHLKAWGPEPNYAEYGFTDAIQSLSTFKVESNEMTITLEQSRKNIIAPELKTGLDSKTDLEDFTMVTANARGKVVHVRFPSSGYYRLDIYAVGKTEKLEHTASFLLECTGNDKPKTYPKYNVDSVSMHVCELIEPKYRELPANTAITFRVKSPALRQAMLGVPMDEKYGARLTSLGELTLAGDEFKGLIKTPKKGEAIYLSGTAAPPNVLWSRLYEFVTV